MEFQKIVNFLDIISDNKDPPKFVTKKLIEVYDQSQENYDVNKDQIYVILVMHILLLKEILLLLKKHLLLMILMHQIIHKLMYILQLDSDPEPLSS